MRRKKKKKNGKKIRGKNESKNDYFATAYKKFLLKLAFTNSDSIMIRFLIALSTIVALGSCKKGTGEPTSNQPIAQENLKGKVVLPAGTSLNVNTLAVASFENTAKISNGEFPADTSENNFSYQFVLDDSANTFLLRYNYPGQKDWDITPRTTALALFMSMPLVQTLKNESKLDLIPKIMMTSEFGSLETGIIALIKASKSLTDSVNALTLAPLLNNLFNKSRTLRIANVMQEPITITKAGRLIGITNAGVSINYAVGLYKDGKLVSPIEIVGGYDVYPTSITDAISHLYAFVTSSTTAEPSTIVYELKGDGRFEIKARSGKPGLNDNSEEAKKAFNYNVVKGAVTIISTYVPLNKLGKPCLDAYIGKLANLVGLAYSFTNIDGKSAATVAKIITDVGIYGLSSSVELISNCKGSVEDLKYFKGVEKYLLAVNIIATYFTTRNVLDFAEQMYYAKPAIDTCFNASGNMVSVCTGSFHEPYLIAYNGTKWHPPFLERCQGLKQEICVEVGAAAGNFRLEHEASGSTIGDKIIDTKDWQFTILNQTTNHTHLHMTKTSNFSCEETASYKYDHGNYVSTLRLYDNSGRLIDTQGPYVPSRIYKQTP